MLNSIVSQEATRAQFNGYLPSSAVRPRIHHTRFLQTGWNSCLNGKPRNPITAAIEKQRTRFRRFITFIMKNESGPLTYSRVFSRINYPVHVAVCVLRASVYLYLRFSLRVRLTPTAKVHLKCSRGGQSHATQTDYNGETHKTKNLPVWPGQCGIFIKQLKPKLNSF